MGRVSGDAMSDRVLRVHLTWCARCRIHLCDFALALLRSSGQSLPPIPPLVRSKVRA